MVNLWHDGTCISVYQRELGWFMSFFSTCLKSAPSFDSESKPCFSPSGLTTTAMSPCEPLTLSRKPTTNTTPSPSPSLEDYTVSPNGFLPEHAPLERLPDPYYAPWESLVHSLPTALAEKTLRDSIHLLPVLSTDRLSTEPEWRRACVVLGFLTHAYIWGGDKPAEVSLPLLLASNMSDCRCRSSPHN